MCRRSREAFRWSPGGRRRYGRSIDAILHLSIPVRDLDEAVAFYDEVLGSTVGRRMDGAVDVWFYGLQLTLQDRPDQSGLEPGGCRHFGVTLDRVGFEAAAARIDAHDVAWLVPVSTDWPGEPVEQTKGKLADPSGNVIELKTYVDPDAAFGLPVTSV